MGDRGFVVVAFPGFDGPRPGIAIYDHWGGSDILRNAHTAAKEAEVRKGDENYFARIFVDQFMKDGRDQETGFGIEPIPDVETFDPEKHGGDYGEYIIVDATTAEVRLVKR